MASARTGERSEGVETAVAVASANTGGGGAGVETAVAVASANTGGGGALAKNANRSLTKIVPSGRERWETNNVTLEH